MSEQPKQIFTLLPMVMADIGSIGKSNENRQQGYRYRSVDQILNALHPALVRHKVCLSVSISDRKTTVEERKDKAVVRTTLTMTVRFIAPDGSFLESSSIGEGLDYNGDKSSNKCLSSAFKYLMFLTLAIPLDETSIDDSDRDPGPADPPRSNGRTTSSRSTASTPPIDASTRATAKQCEAIRSLTKRLKFSRKQLDAALNVRHVTKIEHLAASEASEIITHLSERLPA